MRPPPTPPRRPVTPGARESTSATPPATPATATAGRVKQAHRAVRACQCDPAPRQDGHPHSRLRTGKAACRLEPQPPIVLLPQSGQRARRRRHVHPRPVGGGHEARHAPRVGHPPLGAAPTQWLDRRHPVHGRCGVEGDKVAARVAACGAHGEHRGGGCGAAKRRTRRKPPNTRQG